MRRVVQILLLVSTAICLGCRRERSATPPKPTELPSSTTALDSSHSSPSYEIAPEVRDSLDQFIEALQANDPEEHAFCIKAILDDGKRKTTEWLSPVAYDGESFRSTFRRQPYSDAYAWGDEVIVAPEDVVDWTYIDDERIVGAFLLRKFRSLPERIEAPRLEESGTYTLHVWNDSKEVAWYRVKADSNYLSTPTFWRTLTCPPGTMAAYVGWYGDQEWFDWPDDFSRITYHALGVSFVSPDYCVVGPGEGETSILPWIFESEHHAPNKVALQESRYHVFCFDREPQARGRNLGGKPATEMRSELAHLLGVIVIEPTFDLGNHPTSILPVTHESLHAYSENWSRTAKLIRAEDGRFWGSCDGGPAVQVTPEVVGKLVYALGTLVWEEESAPRKSLGSSEAYLNVSVTIGNKTVLFPIENVGGTLYLTTASGRYRSTYPELLYQIPPGIEALSTSEAD